MLQGLDLPKYWNFCFVCSPAWGARVLCRWRFNQLLAKIKSAQTCKHILIHMCICTVKQRYSSMEIYPMGCKYTEKSDRLRSWGRYRNCSACLWAQRCQRFQDFYKVKSKITVQQEAFRNHFVTLHWDRFDGFPKGNTPLPMLPSFWRGSKNF